MSDRSDGSDRSDKIPMRRSRHLFLKIGQLAVPIKKSKHRRLAGGAAEAGVPPLVASTVIKYGASRQKEPLASLASWQFKKIHNQKSKIRNFRPSSPSMLILPRGAAAIFF